jgi:hypothetical protein
LGCWSAGGDEAFAVSHEAGAHKERELQGGTNGQGEEAGENRSESGKEGGKKGEKEIKEIEQKSRPVRHSSRIFFFFVAMTFSS